MNQVIDYEMQADGTYGPRQQAQGLGDAVGLITELLNQLAPGNRAEAVAEGLIFAGLATDPQGLREAAAANVPAEEFLSYIDVRALVTMAYEGAGDAAKNLGPSAAQLGVAYAAGVGSFFLIDYLWNK